MAEFNVIPRLLELHLLPRCQLVQMPVDLFHGAIFRDQPARSDLSYTFDSWHVVGCVPADRQHLDDLVRRLDSVFSADFLHADDLVVVACLAGFVLPDVRLDQLPVILVRGHHEDIQPFCCTAFRHGADHIVRLEAFQHQGLDVHGLAEFHQRLQRVYHQLRSLLAVRLVPGVHLVSERSSRGIERYGEVLRFLTVQKFKNIFGESVKNGCVSPF